MVTPKTTAVQLDGPSPSAPPTVGMVTTRSFLHSIGLPPRDLDELPSSSRRFPDGGAFRVEIPSVEGPEPFRAVLDAADDHGITVHRISQGSGLMLLTDDEIRDMIKLGSGRDVQVCLFVGPRASWDIGVQATSPSGRVIAGSLRGTEQLVYGIEDVRRGCELGVRSVLVADIGQLATLDRMRTAGHLPADLAIKTSISLPAANPATARLLEDLGADSINLPVDLTLPQIATIRQAVALPLDLYVEGADDFGSPLRYYDIPELVRTAAPIYLKFTVRNAAGIYPSGLHLREYAIATARERVHRAAIGIALLNRYTNQETRGELSRDAPVGG